MPAASTRPLLVAAIGLMLVVGLALPLLGILRSTTDPRQQPGAETVGRGHGEERTERTDHGARPQTAASRSRPRPQPSAAGGGANERTAAFGAPHPDTPSVPDRSSEEAGATSPDEGSLPDGEHAPPSDGSLNGDEAALRVPVDGDAIGNPGPDGEAGDPELEKRLHAMLGQFLTWWETPTGRWQGGFIGDDGRFYFLSSRRLRRQWLPEGAIVQSGPFPEDAVRLRRPGTVCDFLVVDGGYLPVLFSADGAEDVCLVFDGVEPFTEEEFSRVTFWREDAFHRERDDKLRLVSVPPSR